MMNDQKILGCYASFTGNTEYVMIFRNFLWGEKGLDKVLKKFNSNDYSKEFNLILLQFYICPLEIEISVLKEVEQLRKKEMSIGVNILLDQNNFFIKNKIEQLIFVFDIILSRLSYLDSYFKRKKINVDIEKLKKDFEFEFKKFYEI